MPQGSGTLKKKKINKAWDPKLGWIEMPLEKRWGTFIVTAVYDRDFLFFLWHYDMNTEK